MTLRQPSRPYSRRPVVTGEHPGRRAAARLDAAEELDLARAIEAGVIASGLLVAHDCPGGATEADLADLVAIGDRARERFFLANLGLVHQAVREQADSLADPDDLFQEGCLGLAEAIVRFDHARGVRFSTHAYRWIRKRTVPAARRAGCAADEPDSRLHFIAVVTRTRRQLEETGQPSGPDAVARELGRSIRWVTSHWTRSLRVAGELSGEVDRLPSPGAGAEPLERPDWWLDELPARERDFVVHRYGLRGVTPMEESDLAALLGVPPRALTRIDAHAREHIRQLLTEGQCASFVLPEVA